MNRIKISQGLLLDPQSRLNRPGNIYIADGKIISVTDQPKDFHADCIIEASNRIVCPGFIELSARLREPGHSRKATITSELKAAARAGITSLCIPPDTSPPCDNPAVAELIREKAEQAGYFHIYPIGALTQGMRGNELSSMYALKKAGCLAVSNAQFPVNNLLILRRAMEYAATHDLLLIYRPEDHWLRNEGCIHEGIIATRYGLPGIPETAETVAVAQCLELAEQTGCKVHLSQLSCARSVELLRQAKSRGLNVTGDVAMHQLHLTENDMIPFDSNYHVIPPLRTDHDKQALRQALATGVIDAVCSDHQPHDIDAKLGAFPETEPGISSMESLLPLLLKLVSENALTLEQGIDAITRKPAEILSLNTGSLAPGNDADLCVFDPEMSWTVNNQHWKSQGQNTPFWGHTFKGRVTQTIQAGRILYDNDISPNSDPNTGH